MARDVAVTGVEQFFEENELIVSKTNLQGHMTYVNDVFLRISGYTEKECVGQPHSMIRHPDMPRAVFNLLWSTIQDGREIFAYVMNRCKNGDHYWVQAHVTPSRDGAGKLVGFHSNRRVPNRKVLEQHIQPLYNELLAIERSAGNRKEGLAASTKAVADLLDEKSMQYDEFITSLAA